MVWTIVGIVAIIGFVAFGAGAFKSNLTPYVSFQQARATSDAVQVAGKLVQGSDLFDEKSSVLRHEATQVVAIGRFRGGALDAEKLLVKCPSKYQGLDQKASTS